MAGGSAPRYAPSDPSLPPQWKALVDGNTGYIYYWNTETNITQYEKPAPPSGGSTVPPGPPPAPPPNSARPPKLATSLPSVSSPVRTSEKRSSSSSKNGATPPPPSGGTISNNASEEGLICSPPRHVSGSERRHLDTDRRYHDSERRYHNPERRYPSGGIPDSERRYVSGGISESDRRYPTGASQPDHHRADISDHRRTSRPHMSETHGRPSETYGRNLSEHHGRLMHDHHATSGSANALRSGHAMSESAQRPSPRSIPSGSTHLNAADSSWGGSDSSRHAHGLPVGPGRSASSSRNDRDGRGNMGSLTKLAPVLPGPHGQQDGMRVMHYDQARPTISSHLDGPLPGAPIGSLKRPASEYPISVPDARKRPRILEPFVVSDVQTYRMHHEITVVGDNVPPPFVTFDSGKFPAELHRELCAAGFTAPTPIQAQSWPIALQNRDIVAIAKTGSGKTLGYLLPAFLLLRQTKTNSRAGPIVLVLAPTRELATQIQDEAVKFGRSSRISTTCVYGGAPKGPQLRDLERGADIVIATPGRLNDFLEVKKISLRQVAYLVLDEADRMLDMGFEPQIRKIVKEVPSSRQTLMFTATWPREVRKIAADLLVHPVQVNIGNSDELTANKAITQCVEIVQPYEKLRRLEQILRSQEPGSKVIIFCATKKMCDQLARKLQGFRAASIHGDKSQTERDYVLSQFKSGRSPILVATDVAARGLDVKDIRVVINYDFPTGVEDYVHRIGRTGRAGATGVAYTFFSEQDSKHARELVKILEGAEQKVPPELRHFSARSFQSRGRGWQTELDDRGPEHQQIDIGGRDGSMRVGPRDGGLRIDGSGGLNYPDGARDRSMSRIGSDRVSNIVGREGRISSRAEDAGSRLPYDTRDGIMPTREGDIHGGIGTRVGGMSGIREGGFKRSDGGHKDGWGEHTSADGWGAVGGGGLREAGFRSSEGGHKDGWSEGHSRDDGWNAGTDAGTRVGGPSSLREAGFISSEGGHKEGRGEHPHDDGWGVDTIVGTREEAFKSSESIHKDGWGEHPHDGWGADTRVGTRGGFKSAETIHKDRPGEHPHDDGWGASTRAGTREGGFKNSEGSRKGRPGDLPHDHGWGVRTLAGGISDSREGGFKSVGSGREDGWGVHTRFGGMPDSREGGFKSVGGHKDGRGEHHPREDRWGISTRGSGISDTRRGGFKNMDSRHEDGRGERPYHEGWGVNTRVNEVSANREQDFKSLPSGHKDAQSERPHDRWGVSPRVGGSREGAFRSAEGGNKDGRGERLHDDGWGPSTADGDGDGWGNADGRHAGRDDNKDSNSPSGSRISGVPYGRQSERGRIFDRLGDRKTFLDKSGHRERSTDDRMHGGDFPIKSSVAKQDTVVGSRSRGHSPKKGWTVNHTHGRSRSRSPIKGWEKGRSGRSRSPHSNVQQNDDLWKPTQFRQKRLQSRSPSPRSLNAPRESSSKVLNPANQHSIEDDKEHKDGQHMILPNESEKITAKSRDSKIQPSENHVMDPLQTGADKVTSSDQVNIERDAIKENKNHCVSDEAGAKSINGISMKHEPTDSNVDINVSELEQNIVVKETVRIEGSTVKNHIVTHDSLPSDQITKKNIVDEISASDEHISKSNLSGNADVTTGNAMQEIDTVSSPEEGLIEG